MNWGRDSHLWEGVIAGAVMTLSWVMYSGSQVAQLAGVAGLLLIAVCGAWLVRRHAQR